MELNVNEDFIKKYGEEQKNQGDTALKDREEVIKAVENFNPDPYAENAGKEFRDFVDRTVQRYSEKMEELEEEKGRHR